MVIGYTTIGTSDLKRSTDFYDAVLAPLGLKKVKMDVAYTAYAPTNAPVDFEFRSLKRLIRPLRLPGAAAWLPSVSSSSARWNFFIRLVSEIMA